MKVGLIGLGMVADKHVAALRSAGLTLGPVMGRNFERAQAFAARHETTAVGDVNAVAQSSDFVILLTPPNARVDITKQLVEANTPILAEKPLERDLPAARALVEMCEAANIPFGVTLQYRMRPSAHLLTDLLPRLGRIGTVELRVPWWRDQAYYDTLGRGTYERDGGGVLLTQAIHPIDLMLQFTGPVATVQAMTATALHDMEAEDFAAAGLRFASGATGSLVASVTHFPGGTDTLVLNGTEGSAVLSGDELTMHPRDGAPETVGASGETGGGADPMAFSHALHQGVIADFADSLRTGRAPFITARSALAVHALIDAIQDSGRRGVSVEVAQ